MRKSATRAEADDERGERGRFVDCPLDRLGRAHGALRAREPRCRPSTPSWAQDAANRPRPARRRRASPVGHPSLLDFSAATWSITRHPRVTTSMTGPGHVLMRSPSSAPYKGTALASRPFHELHDYLSTMAGSLDQNPPNADRHITAGGSDWLWAVFAIMALSDLIMIFWTFSRPRGTRLFHQIAVIVLTTATIAYFSMASDLGATPVRAEFSRGNTINRQIWVLRPLHPMVHRPPPPAPRASARNRPFAVGHLHDDVHGLGIGRLRPRWCARA
ncbi:hypothetical protein NUW54_g10236 [Trametes sanguinea]|uniref:Uncharacterized protein n=1 Tax=Trametes sanguinea TaxID=158606 RepID=A0ACC1P201_9APHY|nr:hypothetical protein NUW54_g10236 [Trametes sanguinea]